MGYLFNKFISSYNNSDTSYENIKSGNTVKNNNIFFKDLYSSYTEMISDIIIYVILVCNILTILFFTIIKEVEGEIVKQQINNLLDDIFSTIKFNNNTDNVNNLYISNSNDKEKNILDKFNNTKNNLNVEFIRKIENITSDIETEKKIKENNEIIFKKSMTFLAIINIVCLVILILLWKYKNFDFMYYIKKNLILGLFVIVTELIFLYIISKNYIYIDKKYVITETIKKLKQ